MGRQAGEGGRCSGDTTAAPVRSLKERASQNTADLFLRRNTPLRWGRRGWLRSSAARARSGAVHSRAVNPSSGCGGQIKKQEILMILHFVKLGKNLCSIFQLVDDCVNNLACLSLCYCCQCGGRGARRPCLNSPQGTGHSSISRTGPPPACLLGLAGISQNAAERWALP